MTNQSAVNWFEIPATDIGRAMKFYGTVMGWALDVVDFEGIKMAIFPHAGEGVGGALVQGQGCGTPSKEGAVVYLNGGEDLTIPLARIEAAGGKVVIPKTSIGPHGFFAQFIDSEGNRLALHSMK